MSAGQISNGVYRIKLSGDSKTNIVSNPKKNILLAAMAVSRASLQTWHRRLDYLNYNATYLNMLKGFRSLMIQRNSVKLCRREAHQKTIFSIQIEGTGNTGPNSH